MESSLALPDGVVEDKAGASEQKEINDEDEEYVLLDLEEVFHGAALPSNCSYTLSGLDTTNPILTLGDDLKLVGEYEETIGTCLIFTEHDEKIPDAERIPGAGSKEKTTRKRIANLCKTERRLKFRMVDNSKEQDVGNTQEKTPEFRV